MSIKDIKDRITSHEATFDGLADIKSSGVPDDAGITGGTGSEQSEVSAGVGQSADVVNAGESETAAGAGINGVADTDVVTDTDTGVDPKAYVVTQAQRDAATQGHDANIRAYRDWLATHPLESEEDRKKRERKEKARKLISAVGDGISAMSNIYFTSQYAPDMYTGRKSMADAAAAQIEKARAEREKNADQYMRFSLALGKEQGDRNKTLRELEAEMERRKIAAEEAARKRKEHEWLADMQDDKRREQKGKADKVGYEAITAQAEAETAPELQTAKLETERARKGSLDASAANSRASAAAHGRSNVSEYRGLGKDGKLRPFETRQAAIDYERRQGTYDPAIWGDDLEEIEYTETRRTPNSQPQSKTSTKTKRRGYPARPAPENKSTAAENGGKKKTGVKWK